MKDEVLVRPARTNTRVVASYPNIEVRDHQIPSEGNRRVVTIELRDWAVVAAVTSERRWLLVEQHRHGIDRATTELAGGIVDEGEEPLEAAGRELEEETGYVAGKIEPLGWVHPNPAMHGNRAFFFLATECLRKGEPKNTIDEVTLVRELSGAELDQAIESGKITHAMALLGIERARQKLRGVQARTSLRILEEMRALQTEKVISLARRLKPGLTAEDIRNPHDFPELNDPDFHFEDGQLAATVAMLLALRREGAVE